MQFILVAIICRTSVSVPIVCLFIEGFLVPFATLIRVAPFAGDATKSCPVVVLVRRGDRQSLDVRFPMDCWRVHDFT